MTRVPFLLLCWFNDPRSTSGQDCIYKHLLSAARLHQLIVCLFYVGIASVSHAQEGWIGEFRYMADAASFTPCDGGESYPVAQEGAYVDLERRYLETTKGGDQLVVVLDGRIEPMAGMKGGEQATLIVDRLAGVVPGLTCDRARADSNPANMYWRILSFESVSVEKVEGVKEPHLILRADDYSATVGCNTLTGGYTASLPDFTFAGGASTRMACQELLAQMERQLAATLQGTATARVVGPTLELYDPEGVPLAFLEAVALP